MPPCPAHPTIAWHALVIRMRKQNVFFRHRFYVFLARIKHLEKQWKCEDEAQHLYNKTGISNII